MDDTRIYTRALSADEIAALAGDNAKTTDTVEINVLDSMVATSTSGGGLSINTVAGGGNDAYLQADDGGAILGGLTQFTLELNSAQPMHPTTHRCFLTPLAKSKATMSWSI